LLQLSVSQIPTLEVWWLFIFVQLCNQKSKAIVHLSGCRYCKPHTC